MNTPKTVQDALQPVPLAVGDLVLQPISIGTLLFLERIGSPLVGAGNAGTVTALELFRAVYVLTQPLPELIALWARGAAEFDAAVIGFASRLDVRQLEPLTQKVLQHLSAAFASSATLAPPPTSDSYEVLPLAGATQRATGSAGSSTSLTGPPSVTAGTSSES